MSTIPDFNLVESFNEQLIPFDFLDISLSDTFFESLEITFGPKTPSVHKEIINMYLKELNVSAKKQTVRFKWDKQERF